MNLVSISFRTRFVNLAILLCTLASGRGVFAAEYQWAVPVPALEGSKEHPQAFLWIPPNCQRVRAVVFAQHNMEEEPILEHPEFRKTLAELEFAEVWVAPTFDGYFRFDKGAGEKFDAMMKSLADVCGYSELAYAPVVPMGHSAAASLPEFFASWKPQRTLAMLLVSGQWPFVPFKEAPPVAGRSIDGVPDLVTIGEYEWADQRSGDGVKIRSEHPGVPMTMLACPADGHFEPTDEKVQFLTLYLKKAAEYRLPKDAPPDRAPELKPIDPTKTGWLIERWHAGKDASTPAAPVGQYAGDPNQAFWCFDEETAHAIDAFQSQHRGKAALIGYVQDGQIVPQNPKTHQQVTLKFQPQDDGITFKLTTDFLDTVPEGRPTKWTGQPAGASIEKPVGGPPIELHRITGPIKQLSPDTFVLDLYRTSFLGDRRGNEAWLVAIWPGNDQYKRAVQQSKMSIPMRNADGATQKITFPKIADLSTSTKEVKLAATSDAGMPVHYYVHAGPAEIDGDTLKLLPIPPRAKYPIQVKVVAWQFGRSTEPKIQSAEPVEQTFAILGSGTATAPTAAPAPVEPPMLASQSQTPAQSDEPFTIAETGPAPEERIDTTYQWSLPMPTPAFERRAYLWVPPQCKRVRGVVVGLQNMLEKFMFQNGDFRDACAESDLAILYIAPGSVSIKNDDPALSLGFKDPKEGSRQLAQLLNDMATVSGYREIAFAPLITVGHSAATPFVWGYTYANPDRVIASIPYKGWALTAPGGVPMLHVSSEWAEVGGPNWGTTWLKNDKKLILQVRSEKENPIIGEYSEIGNGHFAWQPASGKILGMFIKKTVASRLPENAPTDSFVKLKAVSPESGVLVDAETLGRPNFKTYKYADYPGDKKGAYWYLDEELATTINDYMASNLAKKPQVIDFMIDGKPSPLEQRGMADTGVKLLPDGITWKVQACFLNIAPPQLQYGDQPLGHAGGPVYFRAGSGAIRQVGPDTFKVWLGRGGVERQGPPWDPWVIATHPGDDIYRSADRPIHFWVDIRRKDGKPQAIDFPTIPNAKVGDADIKLRAKADSGLPVQYFVVSGPIQVTDDGNVNLLPIPPRAKFPIKAQIGAFQWGRGNGEKVQSAGPVVRELLIGS